MYFEPNETSPFICRYLGHLYMAEAQVALDKIADAIQHLNPELVVDINLTLPENKTEQGKSTYECIVRIRSQIPYCSTLIVLVFYHKNKVQRCMYKDKLDVISVLQYKCVS